MKLKCNHAGRGNFNWLELGRVYTLKEIVHTPPVCGVNPQLVELVEIPNVLYGMWRFIVVDDDNLRIEIGELTEEDKKQRMSPKITVTMFKPE